MPPVDEISDLQPARRAEGHGLARRLAAEAVKSIRWAKQMIDTSATKIVL
jgi:hypothetical protein